MLVGAYNYLDLTPKGRNEDEIMEWVRHHDRYDNETNPVDAMNDKRFHHFMEIALNLGDLR